MLYMKYNVSIFIKQMTCYISSKNILYNGATCLLLDVTDNLKVLIKISITILL